MVNLSKLKKERADVIQAMRALTTAAEAREGKCLTESEGAEWATHEANAERLKAEIEAGERSNYLEMNDLPEDPKEPTADTRQGGGEQVFRDLGEQLVAVRDSSAPGATVDPRLLEVHKRAGTGANESVPSAGGYLVESDKLGTIVKRMYETSILAGRCRRQTVGPNANGLVWNEVDESSRVAGSRNGGVRAYWKAEAGTVTASKPKFAQREVKLGGLMALAYVTDELLQDSTAMTGYIDNLVGEEMSFVLDDAIVRGPGAGLPLGILNADATVSVAKESGQAADTVVYENVLKMRARMYARSMQNAAWFINQDVWPQLSTMAFAVGTGGTPVYLPAGGVSVDGYDRLFGRPVIPIEQCSTVGTVGDIIFADMGEYMLIEKGGLNKAVSIHVQFVYEESVFRFSMRVNGTPMWSFPLTPYKGTDTVSPYVTLASRD